MAEPKILTLGHSPDADDAFMFYALAEGKIDTRGYSFKHILEDIESLNQRATRGELHISAISIHAYAYVQEKYALLPSGASMGDGYGPLLVTKQDEENVPSREDELRVWLKRQLIAVPGVLTSAYLALRLYLGEFDAVQVRFDEIFDCLEKNRAGVGLIIHEGQLTYAARGLQKLLDLGGWWTKTRRLPLPLGGNVIRKDIPPEERHDIAQILRESVRYALEHRAEAVDYAMPLAREMNVPEADRFIGMYVNDYTLDYGPQGRRAIYEFLRAGHEAGVIPAPVELEFVT
jgi:1,4-dihydroxy-6-naphthoate synthase